MLSGRGRTDERGFSLVEMMVVTVVLGVVVSAFFGLLISLNNTENRVQALAGNQETVRFGLDRVGRDLLAANAIDAFGATATYATQVQVELGTATPPTYALWKYDPAAKTLSRVIEPTVSGGTPTSSSVVLTGVSNVTFSYFDSHGNDLVASTGATAPNVANCAVRIRVSVTAASNPGPLPFTETKDLELRNRLPGGILGCAA